MRKPNEALVARLQNAEASYRTANDFVAADIFRDCLAILGRSPAPRDVRVRDKEVIGGGFVVFRRGKRSGRIAVSAKHWPFEHPSLEAASAEAHRLLQRMNGERFSVFQEVCQVPSVTGAKE